MDPESAVWTDRLIFDSELNGLIEEAVTSGTLSTSSPLPKRAADGSTPAKRLKTKHDLDTAHTNDGYSLYVHPSRRVLLDRPDTPSCASSPTVATDAIAVQNPQTSPSAPPTAPRGPALQRNKLPSALGDTIRRQWDPSKDIQDYELLLEHRRNEKLKNVDRYVPLTSEHARPLKPAKAAKCASKADAPFALESLPEKIRESIFKLVLVNPDPITVNFYWLRPFLKGHSRVPITIQQLEHDGSVFTLPIGWDKLMGEVRNMQEDMQQFSAALVTRGIKTKGTRSPSRGTFSPLCFRATAALERP